MFEELREPTVITIRNGYGTYSVSTNHSDVSLDEMFKLIERILLAAGYAKESIKQYLGED